MDEEKLRELETAAQILMVRDFLKLFHAIFVPTLIAPLVLAEPANGEQ